MTKGRVTSPAKQEQAKALYAIEDNYLAVSRKMGLPVRTVWGIINEEDKDEDYAKYRKAKKLEFIANAWDQTNKLFNLVDEKRDEMGAKDAIIGIGVLTDKAMLVQGEGSASVNVIGDKIIVQTGVPRAEDRPKG